MSSKIKKFRLIEIDKVDEEISKEMQKARASIERCEQCKYQLLCKSGDICVYGAYGKINQSTVASLIRQSARRC